MTLRTPGQEERQIASRREAIQNAASHYPMMGKVNTREYEQDIIDPVYATKCLITEHFGFDAVADYNMSAGTGQTLDRLLEARWNAIAAKGSDDGD